MNQEKIEKNINIEEIDFDALRKKVGLIKKEEMAKKEKGENYDPHFDFIESDKLIEEDLMIFDKFLNKILTKKELADYKIFGKVDNPRVEFKYWLSNRVLCNGNLEWFDHDMWKLLNSKNMENKDILREKLVNEFFDKYFSEQIKNEADEIKTIEIKREELNKLIEAGESVENLLYKINERGYIFHGSSHDIKELEPKKGECMLGREINKLTAVYAINQPSVAIFHAVMPEHKIKGKFIKKWHGNKHTENGETSFSTIFEMNKATYEDFSNNPHNGYIYLLRQKDFKQIDYFQFINEKKYIPTYKIPVKKEDFEHEIKIIDFDELHQKVELMKKEEIK